MPRSYSFDHFTANKQSVSRAQTREAKRQYHESEVERPEEKAIHYGERFAETHAKLHERASQADASEAAEAPEVLGAPGPVNERQAEPAVGSSLPSAEASPRTFGELAHEARSAAGQLRSAALRVVNLPRVVLRVAAHQLGSKLGLA